MGLNSTWPELETDDRQGFFTFAELRALVAEGMRQNVPDDAVVRGHAIPFRMADLGVKRGSVMRSLALDVRPEK